LIEDALDDALHELPVDRSILMPGLDVGGHSLQGDSVLLTGIVVQYYCIA
jgi:hypothetical protein